MKKKTRIFGIITIVAVIGFLLMACGEVVIGGDDKGNGKNNGTCTHDFSLWQETTAPTCAAAGEDTEKCSKCSTLGINKRTGRDALKHEFGSGSVISEFVEKSECTIDGCGAENHNFLLSLGDTGPGGGKIIYVADGKDDRSLGFTMTDDDTTAYYLEVSLSNIIGAYWASSGFHNINIPGTETAIGTGRKNTALILATDANAPPARACTNYKVEGFESFTDWFLPSREELYQFYLRRDDFGITFSWHWSSSQWNAVDVWLCDFYDNGRLFWFNKLSSNVETRAVRAF